MRRTSDESGSNGNNRVPLNGESKPLQTFDVYLTRTYRVRVDAEDERSARRSAEFFTGHITDDSNERDHTEYKFQISEIEMIFNDALEAEEVFEE